jgi:hypothetical protein
MITVLIFTAVWLFAKGAAALYGTFFYTLPRSV